MIWLFCCIFAAIGGITGGADGAARRDAPSPRLTLVVPGVALLSRVSRCVRRVVRRWDAAPSLSCESACVGGRDDRRCMCEVAPSHSVAVMTSV